MASSFTEMATRIISDLAEVTPASEDDDGRLLQRVRHCARPYVADLDGISKRRRMGATKEECDQLRDEGTKVFQV